MAHLIDKIATKAAQQTPNPPARPEEIAAVESRFGFELPPLLKALFVTVGDGGFGPSSGGICSSRMMADSYDPHFDPINDDYFPNGVVDLCSWGCGQISAVDCLASGFPVYWLDGDGYDKSNPAGLYERCPTLEDFFLRWLEGEDYNYYCSGRIVTDPLLLRPPMPNKRVDTIRLPSPSRNLQSNLNP